MEAQPKGWFERLSGIAGRLDDMFRTWDFNLNRTKGGSLDKKRGISRHSHGYLLLPVWITFILILGLPEIGPRLYLALPAAYLVRMALLRFGALADRKGFSVRSEMFFQVALVSAAACLIFTGGEDIYEKGGGLYRHLFVLIALVVSFAILLSGMMTRWVWRSLSIQNNYGRALEKTELFISRDKALPLGWGDLIRSLLTLIQGTPLQLLLVTAILSLMSPPSLLETITITSFIVSLFILFLGGFYARLNFIWTLFQSVFFRGGALIISLGVIGLSGARLWGISYVTTIFDTAAGIVILFLFANAYLLVWWYDYWTNRLLAQELLNFLSPHAGSDPQIDYPIATGRTGTSVYKEGRVLQIFGSSRFVVIGSSEKREVCFQSHSFEGLFERLAISGWPGGKAYPSPEQVSERIFDCKCLSGSLLVLLLVLVFFMIHRGIQMPQLTTSSTFTPSVSLKELISPDRFAEREAILVAASGGGTRAALYTASVLEGLARQGKGKDLIMGSGVSGGGAALAYFAGERESLSLLPEAPWNQFFHAMKQPFIQDVINGSFEWRMITGSRLGLLLSESFIRRWNLPADRNTLGDITGFGLILNTAIAGCFTCDPDSPACMGMPFISAERRFRDEMTHTALSGGRLILTNLSLGDGFAPGIEESGGPSGLPVVIDDPGTRLEVAAALNANFPPVFSNAAIDVDRRLRYWVTDGGAVDNRGIEMLLYAFREALGDCATVSALGRLPRALIVVIDASAYSDSYSQDRGIGAMMGAGTQFVSLLIEEQLRSIRDLYEKAGQEGRFRFVYLPMPRALRESGSFGTHWMLQPHITVSLKTNGPQRLTGEQMIGLLRAMHGTKGTGTFSPQVQAVFNEAMTDTGWRAGAKALGFVHE